MNKLIPYDAALVTSYSEIVAINTNLLNGRAIAPKAGIEYPFPTAARQWEHRAVRVRWITFKEDKRAGNMQPQDGLQATITLRDTEGNYIVQDLPVWRLNAIGFNNWQGNIVMASRLPFWTPVNLDWKRCFLRLLVTPTVGDTFRFAIDYEPR